VALPVLGVVAAMALAGLASKRRNDHRCPPRALPERTAAMATGPIVALVPAHNEEPTVASVVSVLLRSRAFAEVVVVNDGSTDRTAELAEFAGARVISTPRNLGKGGAMLYAYKQIGAVQRVGFFDADLLGLRVDHVHRLVAASNAGYDQACGYRDKGLVQDLLQVVTMPLITGERIVQRWVLDALPHNCWSGFAIETAINFTVERNGGRTVLVTFDGVSMRTKSQKTGYIAGVRGHLRMLGQMRRARLELERSGGCSCGP
jgi:hypothetical protein